MTYEILSDTRIEGNLEVTGDITAAEINNSGTVTIDGTNCDILSTCYVDGALTGAGGIFGTFNGNGASVTNLNASNLATGTVPDARLSGNVALETINNTFSGTQTFQTLTATTGTITTLSAGSGTVTNNLTAGTFTGKGSGLTHLPSGQEPKGRLTSTNSGYPQVDSASINTIFYMPYLGNTVPVYDTTLGIIVDKTITTTSPPSINLSGLTTGALYDVFAYSTGSGSTAVGIALGQAWTNTTTRPASGGLTYYNGLFLNTTTHQGVNAVNLTSLQATYLGTIRATSATTTANTMTQRFVWNMYNRLPMILGDFDGTNHTHGPTTAMSDFRPWNNTNGSCMVEWVHGLYDQYYHFMISCTFNGQYFALTVDAATGANIVTVVNGSNGTLLLDMSRSVPVALANGYHYAQIMEANFTTAAITWYSASLYAHLWG